MMKSDSCHLELQLWFSGGVCVMCDCGLQAAISQSVRCCCIGTVFSYSVCQCSVMHHAMLVGIAPNICVLLKTLCLHCVAVLRLCKVTCCVLLQLVRNTAAAAAPHEALLMLVVNVQG